MKTLVLFFIAHSWVLFLEKMVLHAKLRHALNYGGEKKLVFSDGTATYLDAWRQMFDDVRNKNCNSGDGFNFHGV